MADWKICCRINVSRDVVVSDGRIVAARSASYDEERRRGLYGHLIVLLQLVTVPLGAFPVETYTDPLWV